MEDVYGDLRYFSTTDYDYDDFEDRYFAASDKLSDYETGRGYGRAYLLGGISGAAGRYAGAKEAEKLSDEGYADDEVLSRSTKKGRRVGALTGLGIGAGASAAGAIATNHLLNKAKAERMEDLAKLYDKADVASLNRSIDRNLGNKAKNALADLEANYASKVLTGEMTSKQMDRALRSAKEAALMEHAEANAAKKLSKLKSLKGKTLPIALGGTAALAGFGALGGHLGTKRGVQTKMDMRNRERMKTHDRAEKSFK